MRWRPLTLGALLTFLTPSVWSAPPHPDGRQTPLQDDLIVYRGYGGTSGPQGARDKDSTGVYYTLTKPTYREGMKNSNSLPPGNAATHYDELRIKKGTEPVIGVSASQSFTDVHGKTINRPGGGIEIFVRMEDVRRGQVEVIKSKQEVDYGQNFAPRFDLEAQLNRSQPFSRIYYKMQEEGRYWRVTDYSVRAYSASSAVVTDSKTISETVSNYGRFPGGVLLEASAAFTDGTQLRTLELDLADASFLVNGKCKYDPGLTLEEISILWNHIFVSDDYKHFGAVSQKLFRGVPGDSIVALWLGLADSELGAYAYGYDIQSELFDSPLSRFENAQLRRLGAISRMDGETLRRQYYLLIHALHPRLYLKAHAVEMRCENGHTRTTKHVTNIHFQVFHESPDGKAHFTAIPPGDLAPEESRAAEWISQNIAEIASHSPAMQRILKYSELLSLMRLARARDLSVNNRETLRVAYKARRHLTHAFDVYMRADGLRTGEKNRQAVLVALKNLEAKYSRIKGELTPHERIIVVANLYSLSWWLSKDEAQGQNRFVVELDRLVNHFRGNGISSVQEDEVVAVKNWVSAVKELE